MRKRKLFLTVIAVLIAALVIGLAGWYLWNANESRKLYNAIEEAWNRDLDDDMPEYLQYLDEISEFQIDSIEKGEPWVVTVTVTGLDLAGDLKPKNFAKYTDPEDIDRYLLSLAKKADPLERTAVLYAWPEEDGYRIQFSETFIDAMTGGVYSFTLELIAEITGGEGR